MLIVGINGSPDRSGSTAFLIEEILKHCVSLGAQTQIIQVMDALREQERPYCIACATPCPEKCHQIESLANAYDLLRKCDALVVGSPVYFGTLSAPLKAFWDKSRNLRGEKALVNKPAGAVAVGAARFGGQETTVRAIQDILLVHGMRIVGDGSERGGAGHQGVCATRPANEDSFAIERARIMAQGLYEASRERESRG